MDAQEKARAVRSDRLRKALDARDEAQRAVDDAREGLKLANAEVEAATYAWRGGS